ncbi:unnamed protein product [Lepeophtheirus salmonis]|uniref:(salmon louse) hypothetical protein n=1 Tax=Lepeophtheirus salmonis TaxID=72036 RepID=A0A7R8CWA5_LEPSM|nr:unnamed protein product [Lepeophtheirus salmonis]CAF2950477.1 unnamed protein product [Lepeophtheirus salmonis]
MVKVSVSTKTGIISFKCRKKYRLLGNKESLCENESSSRKIAFMESEEMETDKVACVKLEYLMRGATIGFIKITQVYEDLKPDMLIKINDEQGNTVRGEGYLSDIAIRKIIILRSNEDCSKDEDDPIRDPIRHISPTSCFDRCHSNISTFETMWTEGICSCNFPNCEKFSSCCLDIYEECHVKAHSGSSSSNSQKASHDHDFYTSLVQTMLAICSHPLIYQKTQIYNR